MVHPRPRSVSDDGILPISTVPKQKERSHWYSVSRFPVSAGKGSYHEARTAYVAVIFQDIVLMEYGTQAFRILEQLLKTSGGRSFAGLLWELEGILHRALAKYPLADLSGPRFPEHFDYLE